MKKWEVRSGKTEDGRQETEDGLSARRQGIWSNYQITYVGG